MPSGETIHGVIGLDVHAGADAPDWGVLMSMPMRATGVLEDDDVHIVIDFVGRTSAAIRRPTTTDAQSRLPGLAVEPGVQLRATSASTSSTRDNADDLFGYGVNSDQGFKLNFTSPSTGDSFVDAVWAYTAP